MRENDSVGYLNAWCDSVYDLIFGNNTVSFFYLWSKNNSQLFVEAVRTGIVMWNVIFWSGYSGIVNKIIFFNLF